MICFFLQLKLLKTDLEYRSHRNLSSIMMHLSTIPTCLLMLMYWTKADFSNVWYFFATTYISLHYSVCCSTAGTLGWFTCKRLQALSDTILR